MTDGIMGLAMICTMPPLMYIIRKYDKNLGDKPFPLFDGIMIKIICIVNALVFLATAIYVLVTVTLGNAMALGLNFAVVSVMGIVLVLSSTTYVMILKRSLTKLQVRKVFFYVLFGIFLAVAGAIVFQDKINAMQIKCDHIYMNSEGKDATLETKLRVLHEKHLELKRLASRNTIV
jgi:hypothetical protein